MTWMTRFMVDMPAMYRHRLSDCYAWHQAIWQCTAYCPHDCLELVEADTPAAPCLESCHVE